MSDRYAHLDEKGRALMVDVGNKPPTERRAVARGLVRMQPQTLQEITSDASPKGDVFAAARLAGIMAAKRTPELIPLCHGLALTSVAVRFSSSETHLIVEAEAKTRAPTGVEMEALCAVSVACLTIYDMVKSRERGLVIETIALIEKEGGRSGLWRRNG